MSISQLDPFIDESNVIHVGGRLQSSHISDNSKHPILLPRKEKVSDLIIKLCHSNVAHGGCGFTLNEIQGAGYWIVGANSAIKAISNCVECQRFRGRVGEQKMANLPACRLKEAAPFTHCGVDMFGPFTVKQRRSTVKRYGAMFTCMASRAVHIEVTFSLDTDSFIIALRRLVPRRGNIRSICSDNGSNFIGAEQELKKAYMEMDDRKIQSFLLEQGGDWIRWHKNPPLASHMGGVWEQQIRSARAILGSLLKTHGECLDDGSLLTVMTEVEGILNSGPLTIEVLNDPTSLQPLSPVNILTMKSKVVSPPSGEFSKPDICRRKWWGRIQHIANEFWSRWKKQYLQLLPECQKWEGERRNFKIWHIVVVDQNIVSRNHWPMARITDVNSDKKGLVHSVLLRM